MLCGIPADLFKICEILNTRILEIFSKIFMFQNVITPCVEDREYSTKADSSRELSEKIVLNF